MAPDRQEGEEVNLGAEDPPHVVGVGENLPESCGVEGGEARRGTWFKEEQWGGRWVK